MRELDLGFCGLDCERCPVFVATANDDDALRRETAEAWSRLYGDQLAGALGRRVLQPAEMSCRGCRSATLFVGCSACGIRACATERGVDSCARCEEYARCALIEGFHSAHPDARAALDELRAASLTTGP